MHHASTSKMGILSPKSSWWRSLRIVPKSNQRCLLPSSPVSKVIFMILLLGVTLYLIWLPVSFAVQLLQPSVTNTFAISGPGVDPLQSFAGSAQCSIVQADLYLATQTSKDRSRTPFCKNRAALLTALSHGGRHGFDEPYVGKGCTYRWFATHEICMILERFNTITLLGDSLASDIYTALNVLLREDLALGGLQQWSMSERDMEDCACENQFLDKDCLAFRVRSSSDVTSSRADEGIASSYFCERIPHTYVSITSSPASIRTQDLFKDQTYFHFNPWQPSPVILSFGQLASLDINKGLQVLDEWLNLAAGAQRNVPFLVLGPPAVRDESSKVLEFMDTITSAAKDRHVDVLSLWNMTLQANSPDGWQYGERDALVQAMMVVNWLAMLPTS